MIKIMKKSLYLFFVILLPLFLSAKTETIIYPALSDHNDPRMEYDLKLLRLILDSTKESFGNYILIPSDATLSSSNQTAQRNVLKNQEDHRLSLMINPTTKTLENELMPVRIPIYKGLLGHRIFLIHKENQPLFDKITEKQMLTERITIGQGEGWADVDILQNAGFSVTTKEKYMDLFQSLMEQKFTAFGRGVHEAPVELAAYQSQFPDMSIENNLIVHYPYPVYFFTSKSQKGQALAKRLKEGFQNIISNGSFELLFLNHFGPLLKKVNFYNRKVMSIENPLLPSKTPLQSDAFWMTGAPFGTQKYTSLFNLTPEEKRFIDANPVITVANDTGYPPFDFQIDGKPVGYSMDLIRLLTEKLGIRLHYVSGDDWGGLVNAFKKGAIDLLTSVSVTEKDKAYTLYTSSYLKDYESILIRAGDETIKSIFDLNGKTIALPEEYEFLDDFKQKNIAIRHLVVKDMSEAVKAVAAGNADATIESGMVLQYLIDQMGFTQLKKINLTSDITYEFHFGVRKELPILQGLLDKALLNLPIEEKRKLRERWFGQTFEQQQEVTIFLSDKEKAYLARNPVATIAMMTDIAPVVFRDGDVQKGFTADLLKLITQKSGLKFDIKPGFWSENIEKFKNAEVDLISELSYKKERESFALFTEPYYEMPIVAYSRNDFGEFQGLKSLEGKTIGVEKDIYFLSELKKIPNLKIVEFDGARSYFKALAYEKIDLAISSLTHMRLIQEEGFLNLQLAGEILIPGIGKEDLRFGITIGKPELAEILRKSLEAITQSEYFELKQRWFTFGNTQSAKFIPFTDEERQYIRQKSTISMCGTPNWMPVSDIDENGNPQGMLADFRELFSERAGLRINFIPSKSWLETLQQIQAGTCDVLPLIIDNEERRQTMNFTQPLLDIPLVVATMAKAPFIENIDKFMDKPYGIVKGYATIDLLKKRHPNIQIREVTDVNQGLSLVRSGELFGYIDSSATIAYYIQRLGYHDLKISGKLDDSYVLSAGIKKDAPTLKTIMQKIVESIDESEKQDIYNKWVSIKYQQGFDYALLWKVLAVFALIVLGIIYWNRQLSKFNKEIKEKNRLIEKQHHQVTEALNQVATLLNNSEEGFLSFGADLRIEGQYSLECEKIFGQPVSGLSIAKLLFEDDRSRQKLMHDTFQTILEENDEFRREMLLELLPSEIKTEGGWLSARYRQLDSKRFMMILLDITAEKELEKQIKGEQKRLRFIVNVIKDRDDILETIHDYEEFLKTDFSQPDDLSILYRQIHTYKGLFDQYEFCNLPEKLHDAESALDTSIKDGLPNVSNIFLKAIESCRLALTQDLDLIKQVLGNSILDEELGYFISNRVLKNLESSIRELFSSKNELMLKGRMDSIQMELRKIRFKSVKSLLDSYPEYSVQLARRLNKDLNSFSIEGDDVEVDPEIFQTFAKTLIHVFRNAVDHGIETPEERLEAGKAESANIGCRVYESNECVVIEITDDGRGMDPERFKNRAEKLGIHWYGNPYELIFEDTFSTKKVITEISGRGIGLPAVKAELMRMKGRVEVQSAINEGTLFRFTIPLHKEDGSELDSE